MKILEINTFNKIVGGVESYVAAMAQAITNRGHELVPLYLMPPEEHPGLVPSHRGYYMEELTPHYTRHILETFRSQRASQIRSQFMEILDAEQPDIIHCNNIYSPVILREVFHRLPVVRTVHDYRFLCPILLKMTARGQQLCKKDMGLICLRERCVSPLDHNAMRHMMMLKWEQEVSRDFDHIITKSRHMKRQLMQVGFTDEQVEVIPLSILPPLPHEAPAQREPDAPATLLFVGRVAPEKGLNILLRAVRRLSGRVILKVAGDGPSMEEAARLTRELGLQERVDFLGWQSMEELNNLYRWCDIVVVPSVWPEPFGLVGLEAFSHGKPVVGFDVGGIPEWLDHEHTGLLVPVGDEEGLTQAMEKLLCDPELCARMGESGRAEINGRFSMDVAAGKLLSLLENHIRR